MLRITDTAAGSAWHELLRGRSAESIERGADVYTPAAAATALFVIATGAVSLYLRSPEGRQITLRVVEAGQVFGHVALLWDEAYDTFAQAQSDLLCYRVPSADVRMRIERDPGLGLALLLDMGQHRIAASARLEDVAFRSVPARLAGLLLELARAHGGESLSAVLPRHSHRQLAEMINAYRETVTKVLNQFRDARLLEIDRTTITLVNLARLRELAQS
jgi:CRP-like cAMP-binding protein